MALNVLFLTIVQRWARYPERIGVTPTAFGNMEGCAAAAASASSREPEKSRRVAGRITPLHALLEGHGG
jgi:hypothetical protein